MVPPLCTMHYLRACDVIGVQTILKDSLQIRLANHTIAVDVKNLEEALCLLFHRMALIQLSIIQCQSTSKFLKCEEQHGGGSKRILLF